jgi:3-dehydroquinate dehydratase II
VINGPNLNLLGTREPQIYGNITLTQIDSALKERGPKLGFEVSTFQSNHEGGIVDRIQAAREEGVDAIIINPGAFTHTSVSIRDALLGVSIPFIECHISNVHAREPWRHHSYFHDKAQAVICGLGAYGYVSALEYWSWKFNDGPMKGI